MVCKGNSSPIENYFLTTYHPFIHPSIHPSIRPSGCTAGCWFHIEPVTLWRNGISSFWAVHVPRWERNPVRRFHSRYSSWFHFLGLRFVLYLWLLIFPRNWCIPDPNFIAIKFALISILFFLFFFLLPILSLESIKTTNKRDL
jgi:hypothetical protein